MVFVTVETAIGAPSGPLAGASPVTVATWPAASLLESEHGATLTLEDASGHVRILVHADHGAGQSALVLAASLTRRGPDEPGWLISRPRDSSEAELVEPAVLLAEGWEAGWQQRFATWVHEDGGAAVEVIVSVGQPHLTSWAGLPGRPYFFADLDGAPAVGLEIEGRGSLVAWSLTDGITATVLTRLSIAETVDFARTLEPVEQSAWESAGLLLPPRVEFGCDYFLDRC